MAGIKRMLKFKKFLHFHYICFLEQQFPTFLAPGTDFIEDSFSKDGGWGVCVCVWRWFQDVSSTLHLLCILLLDHQALDLGGWGLPFYSLGRNQVSRHPLCLDMQLSWFFRTLAEYWEGVHNHSVKKVNLEVENKFQVL